MKLNAKSLFMATLFVVSAFILVSKFLMPTQIHITIQGDEGPIEVGQILSFTQLDVVVIAVSAFLLGISGFYLWFSDLIQTRTAPQTIKRDDTSEIDVRFALRLLDGDKRKVFSKIVESGGEILQKDLHIQTGFSKAKITRILDYLEMKGLIIRKRYGMTNKVIIRRNMRMER